MARLPEDTLFRVAGQALSRQLGKAAWSAIDPDDRQGLKAEVYSLWAAPGGPGAQAGWVTFREEPGRRGRPSRMVPVLTLPDGEALYASILPVARHVAYQVREQQRDIASLDVSGGGKEVGGTREDAEAAVFARIEKTDAEPTATTAADLALLQQLVAGSQTTTPEEAVRATLLRMHLGVPTLPSLPARFLNRRKWVTVSRGRRESVEVMGQAERDLMEYHELGRGQGVKHQRCPTCNALARLLHVPGADGATIQGLVDQTVSALRARR